MYSCRYWCTKRPHDLIMRSSRNYNLEKADSSHPEIRDNSNSSTSDSVGEEPNVGGDEGNGGVTGLNTGQRDVKEGSGVRVMSRSTEKAELVGNWTRMRSSIGNVSMNLVGPVGTRRKKNTSRINKVIVKEQYVNKKPADRIDFDSCEGDNSSKRRKLSKMTARKRHMNSNSLNTTSAFISRRSSEKKDRGAHMKPLHPYQSLSYDYLASNSLQGIEALPSFKFSKGDAYLNRWWLMARKWGLLSGKLAELDRQTQSARVDNYANEYVDG